MAISEKIVDLNMQRGLSREEMIDDICAKGFMFIRDSAAVQSVPLKALMSEHILGMMLMVRAVEGEDEAQRILALVSEKIASH
jgi:hypothetical protein